jgi:hypothetical protein
MLVENDVTNCLRPVRDAMLVKLRWNPDFTNISSLTGRVFLIGIVFLPTFCP